MVFHNQRSSIESEMEHLEKELSYLSLSNHCIHTGPIIRKEENYSLMDIRERRRIFNKMVAFTRQIEVSKILSSVFNAMLPEVEFRKVAPSKYKLFQVADLLCTMCLIQLKMTNNQLSKSELTFFGNIRDLKKNYLKPLSKKEWI